MGRARGPAGREGAVGRPGRIPPPVHQTLVGGALGRAEPSHACGLCPMPGGTLLRKGGGAHNPPGTGRVAPLVERFEATPPFFYAA